MSNKEKIAGHSIPDWSGTDPGDLEDIISDNMNKPNHVIETQPEVPGRCQKCRNPILNCLCNG